MTQTRFCGLVLVVCSFLFFILLIGIWPNPTATAGKYTNLFNRQLGGPETILMVIVLLAGGLGSTVHAVTAFAAFHGTKKFDESWLWWYYVRIPAGMGLALIVYLGLRGGLFSGSFADGDKAISVVNPYGFAALSALAGMFSKQATDKLNEIFRGIFRTADTDDKRDAEPAAPTVDPFGVTLKLGATEEADLVLTVNGSGFVDTSKVQVNDEARATQFVSATELKATLEAADVAEAGELTITVVNGPGEGQTSDPVTIEVS